jgi:hypothetical protein
VIVFGICLSFLAFTSADEWSDSSSSKEAYKVKQISVNSESAQQVEVQETKQQRTFTHYNFIASYLIQESSINRQTKEKREERNFLANLKQIHRIIFSNTLGSI